MQAINTTANGGNGMERKCAHCKNAISIDKNNITNVLQFQNKYYHSQCFEEMARSKANSKRGKPEIWKEALSNICELEHDTKKLLEMHFAKNDLNEWLLNHYNITAVPSTFWQRVADLERGIYRRKKCKPISVSTLFGVWVWGQNKLNEIARNNKIVNNGPKCDDERLIYDLAILINKVPDYLAYKAKQEAEKEVVENVVRVDYNKMIRTDRKIEDGLDDISDLLDDDDD